MSQPTITTTTIRRGARVRLPDGTETRVISTRGGYVYTQAGTYAPWQLAPPAPDPIASARAFLELQSEALCQWSNAALPSRREYELALGHIQALLGLLAQQEGTP